MSAPARHRVRTRVPAAAVTLRGEGSLRSPPSGPLSSPEDQRFSSRRR